MIFTENEYEAIMSDQSKKIIENIIWNGQSQSSLRVTFRAQVLSHSEYPIVIDGRYNRLKKTLTYSIIHQQIPKRIFGLDMGQNHRNPDGQLVGINHIHYWTNNYEDRCAYSAEDYIHSSVNNPGDVWDEFCDMANINFEGVMRQIPPIQYSMDMDLGIF